MDYSRITEVKRLATELDGVLTSKDLEVILNDKEGATVHRAIEKLIEQQVLFRVSRGLYASPQTSLVTIAQRMYPEAYVSTGTVLARRSIIGSIPARKVQLVKLGSPRLFQTEIGTIQFLSIQPSLFFGFLREGAVNWATPEKACLDVCYYYSKGHKFSFNPFSDVDQTQLNRELLESYLVPYGAQFKKFFRKFSE